ncbi:hypothetical protein FisN_7Lh124 [Fistulifera solaris]|uniref:FH2 domain-containing protein n=1 Tax=Fistulifera solaris TaxID=1519565 RepID=A0A1Z5JCL0_FISSO|nr:hypothetical protein FisN_7Lh124 [Fistulifera solaris]|eukprot:GAX11743.1 hypothetical protein FisN_7Lh124 [Fistulifera solaris]
MMRRRQSQLEPPAEGEAAYAYGNTSARSSNQTMRNDPPDHRAIEPSVSEGQNSAVSGGRDPSVINKGARPTKSKTSSWSAAAMRSAMRLSQENYQQTRDPSVANDQAISITKTKSRDPPPDTRESSKKDTFANRTVHDSLGLPPSGSYSSTVGSSSSGSPNSQQRAFLRNFLKKKGEKANVQTKTMATAKQKLLRNVLQKSQGGVIRSNHSAEEAQIYRSNSGSPTNGSLREKWKRKAAANASRTGQRPNNDPSKEDIAQSTQQQLAKTNLRIDPEISAGEKARNRENSGGLRKHVKVGSTGMSIRQRYEETLREKTFQKSVTDESKAVQTEVDDVHRDEYGDFLDILHEEVMGQHAQLWENFRATMTNTPALTVELKSPAKAFKFDSETKELLMQMNLYLKNVSTVEHLGVTQLVKDKKYRKELSRLSLLAGGSADNSRRSSVLPPILAERVQRRKSVGHEMMVSRSVNMENNDSRGEVVSRRDNIKGERRASTARHSASKLCNNNYYVNEEAEEKSHTKASEVSTIQTALSDDSSVSLNRYDVPSHIEQEYDPVTAQRSNDDNENQSQLEKRKFDTILSTRSLSSAKEHDFSQRTPPETRKSRSSFHLNPLHRQGHQKCVPTGNQNETLKQFLATPKSDSGFEVTLGQFESKMRPLSPGSDRSTSTSGSVVPWKDVRLKSVPSCSPENQGDVSKLSPAFAQLQLRRVDSSSVSPSSAALESQLRYSFNSQSFATNDPTSIISQSTTQQNHPGAGDPTERTPPIQNSKHLRQNTIDSASNYSDESSRITSADACIYLKHREDTVEKVLVSKERIRKTVQTSEDSPPQLVWVLDRSMIKSLSLDMADNQANLFLDEGGKRETLAFVNAEDCLRFANSFYQFSAPSTQRSTDSEIPNSVNQQDEEDDEVSLLDTLNEEEQKVLEMYRRLRKTKAAEDAMQESISQETVRADDQFSLTSQEEELAEKYRGMLRMSFPLAVVKNKMSRDGASPKLFAAIESVANDFPPAFVSAQRMPGSPVSTFSSSCGLSTTEQETAEAYRKLLDKLGNPESIRKKMDDAKVDQKIVGQVLGEDNSKSELSLTPAEEALVQSYLRMLKMSVPEEAVRHKMIKDRASEAVSRAVFNVTKQAISTNELNAEEKAIAEKFKKMLSMGVPKDGVHHKMIREQISQKVMDAVLEVTNDRKPNERNTALPSLPFSRDTTLSEEETSLVSQYKKMLKLQIPREQVLARMQKEGVTEKVIIAVMGKRFGSSESTKTFDSKSSEGTSSNLVSLHWTPLSGKDLDDSIWSRTSKKRGVSTKVIGPEKTEFNELMELFQKKANTGKIRSTKKTDTGTGSEKAKLLDITRSNNVAISLKAFKAFPFEELAEIISFLDPLRKIRGEKCQFIRDILPTSSEIRVIKEYDGSDDRLEPAELWFRHLVNIPRLEVKAHILRTMEMFNADATLLMESFVILDEVCHQVMKSEKLQELLEMVLNIGNIMNEGTRTGGASGFKFDSLLKLTQTKSSDGKTTVLDFLVNVFVSKNQREVLYLTTDFPRCRIASKMMISDMLKEVKSLGDSLEQCKDELEALIKEEEGDDETENDVVDLTAVNSSDLDDPRGALLSAIKAKGSNVPKKPKRFAQRDLFLAVVEDKKPKGKVVLDEVTMNRETGINRLRRFIAEETETYAILIQKRDQALNACRDTSKYCGEGGGHGSIASLLGVLAQFADNLEEAVKKYDQRVQREMRSKKQKSDQSCASSVQTVSTGQTEAKNAKRSLILMVNEMLKDATERTKEDFTKGRVYGNPSKSLQAIYELESVLVSSDNIITQEDPGSMKKEKGVVTNPVREVLVRSTATNGTSPKRTTELSRMEVAQVNTTASAIADFWKKKEVVSMQKSLDSVQQNERNQDVTETDNVSKNRASLVSSARQTQPSEDTNVDERGLLTPKLPKQQSSVVDTARMFSGVKEQPAREENDETIQKSMHADDTPPHEESFVEKKNYGVNDSPDDLSCEHTKTKKTISVLQETEMSKESTVSIDVTKCLPSSIAEQEDVQELVGISVLTEQKENVVLHQARGNEKTPETKPPLSNHQSSIEVLKTVQRPNIPMGSPTIVSEKGESAMIRLARLKREEKTKTRKSLSESPHITKSPLPPSINEGSAQQESAMVQLARQMRKDRRLSANKEGNS